MAFAGDGGGRGKMKDTIEFKCPLCQLDSQEFNPFLLTTTSEWDISDGKKRSPKSDMSDVPDEQPTETNQKTRVRRMYSKVVSLPYMQMDDLVLAEDTGREVILF